MKPVPEIPRRTSRRGIPQREHALVPGCADPEKGLEFLRALDAFKRAPRVVRPSCADVLQVLESGASPCRAIRGKRNRQQTFERELDRYRRDHQRPYPHWTEVLQVALAIGYEAPQETKDGNCGDLANPAT